MGFSFPWTTTSNALTVVNSSTSLTTGDLATQYSSIRPEYELKQYEGCFKSMRKFPNVVNISQMGDPLTWMGLTQLLHRLISDSSIRNIQTISTSIQDADGYTTESNYNISQNYLKIIYRGSDVTYKIIIKAVDVNGSISYDIHYNSEIDYNHIKGEVVKNITTV